MIPSEIAPVVPPISWSQLSDKIHVALNSGDAYFVRDLLSTEISVDPTSDRVSNPSSLNTKFFLDYFMAVGIQGSWECAFSEQMNGEQLSLECMKKNHFKRFSTKHCVFDFEIQNNVFYLGSMRYSANLYLIFPPANEGRGQSEERKDPMVDNRAWEEINEYIFELLQK